MRIASFNINGIRARRERLLEWLQETRPAVACLQEIKCQDADFPAADFEASSDNVTWAWHDGVGYLFFEPASLHARRSGKIVTLWFDHAADPADAKAAYVVLPDVKLEEMEGLAAKMPVRIIQQDDVAHVVETSDHHAIGAIFWKKGEAGGITADGPAVVYLEHRGAGTVITASAASLLAARAARRALLVSH